MISFESSKLSSTNPIYVTTLVLGIVLSIAAMHHGFFEILQGNKSTNSLIIQSISPEYQRWENGEEAFTLIPNFLFSGISTILMSTFIIIYSFLFLKNKYGVLLFFVLFILLTLVGGGIAHFLFFSICCLYAAKMNKPLPFWNKVFRNNIGLFLSKVWPIALIITSTSFLIALEVSIFGLPFTKDKNTILYTCWSILLFSFIFMNIAFVTSFAKKVIIQSEK